MRILGEGSESSEYIYLTSTCEMLGEDTLLHAEE